MGFNELMQQFAAKVGLSGLTSEGDGVAMEIEGVPFGFLDEGEAGTMIVVADIGKQPESADAPLGSMMLKANFMYEALDGVSPEALAERLLAFSRLADGIEKQLGGEDGGESAAAYDASPADANGFMKV